MSDGHRKETRILYKSDLLFYIKIYMKIYSNDKLQQYKYLCIDEGQDLHKADYDILRAMFPNAVFNIFGDTAQALHRMRCKQLGERNRHFSNIYSYPQLPQYRFNCRFLQQKFQVRHGIRRCGKRR